MTHDLLRAKAVLDRGVHTCVLIRGNAAYTSKKAGIAPMADWLVRGLDLRGCAAADRVVGKAAALLFVLGGIREVHAAVMSRAAIATLERHGVACSFDTLAPEIRNREGTGICPMEQAVTQIEDPLSAFRAVQSVRARLQTRKKEQIA